MKAGIRTQTLLLGNGSEPPDLDPHIMTGYPEAHITFALFEGLTSYDAKGGAMPAATERWDVSSGGLVYMFHLRPNLGWSNGDPITAEDFVFFPDSVSFLEVFVTGSGYNAANWSNADFDTLIGDAARTADPLARFRILQQAEHLLLEECFSCIRR